MLNPMSILQAWGISTQIKSAAIVLKNFLREMD